MKRIVCFVLFLIAWQVSVVATIPAAVERFVSSPITQNANVGLIIKNVQTGDVRSAFRSNTAIPPASAMKLLTTATALELLGPDFQFSTYIETDGRVENGTLHGNLYIRGTGDPTLGSQKIGNQNFLAVWAQRIKAYGIQHITGNIVADVSFFDADAINPQWIWEDIGNYYAPGIYALPYMDNTMNVQLRSGAVGTVAEVVKTIPYIEGVEFENHIRCTQIEYDGAYVHGVPYSMKRYLVGSIPSNIGVFGVKGDIPNPPLLLAQHLTKKLTDAGVQVDGEPAYIAESTHPSRTLIYEHRSPELRLIIKETNQQSNNLYAEQLFRYLGSRQRVPANIQSSIDVMRRFWKQRLVDIHSTFICDGSGLSPQDAVSAEAFANLLTYMYKVSPYKEDFLASLPVAGESGTLKGFLAGTHLQGKVTAKSGTTSRIKSYAGYLTDKDGEVYIVVVIVNNGAAKSRVVQGEIERLLLNCF